MRKTYTLIFVVLMMFASCDKYDDSSIRNDIQKLDERVSALEKWQGEVNRNIASLQTIVEALNGRDYVTDVSEIKDDEGYTVGYNVHFNKGGSKTITFNSKEPSIHIPVIGVKTGPDGIYYWTLDGDKTEKNGNNPQSGTYVRCVHDLTQGEIEPIEKQGEK